MTKRIKGIIAELDRLTGGHVQVHGVWGGRVEIGDEQGGGTYNAALALKALQKLESEGVSDRDQLWEALEGCAEVAV